VQNGIELKLAVLVHKALSIACLHSIWRTTANFPLPSADADFDRPTWLRLRFQELTRVWATDHSLLLDRVYGTTYCSAYVILQLISLEFHNILVYCT